MITIDEAITEIKAWQVGKGNPSYDKINLALSLGIEALQEVKRQRDTDRYFFPKLFPGETKE